MAGVVLSKEIAEVLGGKLFGKNKAALGIEIDSRRDVKNRAFWALKGKRDGADFWEEAKNKGAAFWVATRRLSGSGVLVDDTLEALKRIAYYLRKRMGVVIGVTGSYGKTTFKELAHWILKDWGFSASRGNFNNFIGLPMEMINSRSVDAVFEVGINSLGEMDELEWILQPNIGVLTAIGSAHSGNFGSKDEIFGEKVKLFKRSEILLAPSYLEGYFKGLERASLRRVLFVEPIERKKVDLSGAVYEAKNFLIRDWKSMKEYKVDVGDIKVSSLVDLSISLALLMGILHVLGVPFSELEKLVNFESSARARMEVLKREIAEKEVEIVLDCYNASIETLLSGIRTLEKIAFNNQMDVVACLGRIEEIASSEKKVLIDSIRLLVCKSFVKFVFILLGNFYDDLVEVLSNFSNVEVVKLGIDYLDDENSDVVYRELKRWISKLEKPIVYLKASRAVRLEKALGLRI